MKSRQASAAAASMRPLTASRAPGTSRAACTASPGRSSVLDGMHAAAAGCLAVAVRRPRLRVPVIAGFLVTAGVVGGYLAVGTLRDRVVHERVVTGVPARALPAGAAPTGPVELVRGRFRSGEH